MRKRRWDFGNFAAGLLVGALVFGGGTAAAGILAEQSQQAIYVDGQQAELEAYVIHGSNYVKLRDVGQAVGFNVYWDGHVQIESGAPYTGENPNAAPVTEPVAVAGVAAETPVSEPSEPKAAAFRVYSAKGTTLNVGARSQLCINPFSKEYTVSSSNPAVVSLEQVSSLWVLVANSSGTAVITVTSNAGETVEVVLTVLPADPEPSVLDLTANMEIREEMIRQINEVRKENGVSELSVNDALMDAAQDCSAQGFYTHNNQYECESGLAYGYPYGFGCNMTIFSFDDSADIAQKAVTNWVNSLGHFQTMIRERYNCVGVGVTIIGKTTYCYMFVGDPDSINPYS